MTRDVTSRRIRRLPPPGPAPPPSDYRVLLGSKLRLMFRAPSGVQGNEVAVSSWTDEITSLVAGANIGTVTLETDGANFVRKPVTRFRASPTTRLTTPVVNPNIVQDGEGGELFALFRQVISNPGGSGYFIWLGPPSIGSRTFAIASGANTLRVQVLGISTSFAFTDTTSMHLLTGRLENGTRTANLDGVDVASGASVTPLTAANRCVIGDSPGSFDGFVGMCGFINPPMTTEERATFLNIARAEWGF